MFLIFFCLFLVLNHSGEVWYFVFAKDDINTEYIYKYFGNSTVLYKFYFFQLLLFSGNIYFDLVKLYSIVLE